MRIWNHVWTGVVVSLAIGIFLIGGGAYYWAWKSQADREQDRRLQELLTGVKTPPPGQQQVAQAWNADLLTGALVGGVIWVLGNVYIIGNTLIFGPAWLDRSVRPQDQGKPALGKRGSDPSVTA
jgi:hypothetical protein